MASLLPESMGSLLGRRKKHVRKTMFQLFNAEFREHYIWRRDHFASSSYFNVPIVFMIMINSVMIGVEIDYARDAHGFMEKLPWFVTECIFCLVFVTELVLRLHQQGYDYFTDVWNMFDYSLVIMSINDVNMKLSAPPDANSSVGWSCLRILRILRVASAIKSLKAFNQLFLLIQGTLDSLRTVFWVACCVTVLVYCYAVALTTIVGQDYAIRDKWYLADAYVGSVPKSMLTVLQVLTFDNWTSDIARPLMEYAKEDVSLLATCIIVLCIIMLSFGTLNILVGVMVERIGHLAKEHQESTSAVMEKTEDVLLASIQEDFRKCAQKQGKTEIDLRDFKKLIRTQSVSHKLKLLSINSAEAESLFELMDADQSGTLSPDEFTSGVKRVKGPARGTDLVKLISFSQRSCIRAALFVDRLRVLNDKVDEIQSRLNQVGYMLTLELQDRRRQEDRCDETWKTAAKKQMMSCWLDNHRAQEFPALVASTVDDLLHSLKKE
eukprot:TRINITY_DN108090_c0_g1_i1.p1 TRINITY_DN108090_c0_g1~~TRINITY_DN108090_c0_g1_i1.p1  ORF type:complete len:513 (+),score=80.30 TRINITY_DN108090_c0_g1_i1:60-1541(+)